MYRTDFPRGGWTGGVGMDGNIGGIGGRGAAPDKRWDDPEAGGPAARLTVRPDLLTTLERGGTARVFSLVGEADINTADLLRARLTRAVAGGPEDPRAVVFDLTGLTFLDSVALVALIDVQNLAKSNGVAVALAGARDQPARVFQMTKTGRLFAMTATVEEALTLLGATPL